MSEPNKQSFLDSKTILAVLLVGASWLGWQFYMQKKYPDLYNKSKQVKQEIVSPSDTKGKQTVATDTLKVEKSSPVETKESKSTPKSDELGEVKLQKESFVNFQDKIWTLQFSNFGMGLKSIVLKDYKDRKGKDKHIGSSEGKLPFATNVVGRTKPLVFDIKKISENEFLGKANFGNAKIEKRVTIDSKKHTLDTTIMVNGVTKEDSFSGLTTTLGDKFHHAKSSIPFLPNFERHDFFISHDGSEDRVNFNGKKDEVKSFEKVTLVSLGSQYFAQALLDKSDVLPSLKTLVTASTKRATAILEHSILSRKKDFVVHYEGFAGPKSLTLLNSIDASMGHIIDYGFFGVLAKVILEIMKFFYSIFGNWGVAIILLTILVRSIVLPFNLISFKSMKKMQDIQPQIKALRAKYKEEPQKLNQEMMVLFKNNRVNPMGGCLPMVLQFPVFISLYRMIGQSVELYHSPFVFWIQDLSAKDPYYILPVLMSITMFIQQKITPSTMDPTQQKIMMIMPLFFSLLMVTLPSGLTLYIFVSALFGVVQQAVFLKKKRVPAAG